MSLINELAARGSKVINSASETVYDVEIITGGAPTIPTDHKYIHEGKFYQYALKFTVSAGGIYNFVFTTPAASSAYIHFRPAKVSTSGDKVDIELYEGCSTSGGTVVTPVNHNRNSTSAATMIVAYNVSVTSNGTLLSPSYIAGSAGVGGTRSGGETGQENEWVLAPATKYCDKFTNGGTATCTVMAIFQWYEELLG